MNKLEKSQQDNINISQSLNKLQEISQWFDDQENLDVEAALQKMKEGAELIKQLKGKLSSVENEFLEIKKTLSE